MTDYADAGQVNQKRRKMNQDLRNENRAMTPVNDYSNAASIGEGLFGIKRKNLSSKQLSQDNGG